MIEGIECAQCRDPMLKGLHTCEGELRKDINAAAQEVGESLPCEACGLDAVHDVVIEVVIASVNVRWSERNETHIQIKDQVLCAACVLRLLADPQLAPAINRKGV